MRILIVVSALGPGGAERVVSLLSREWARKGASIVLVSFDPASPSYHSLDPMIKVVHLGLPMGRGRAAAAIFQGMRRVVALRQVIRAERPDLVISFLTKVNVVTLLAGKGLGVPLVICERNNPFRQDAHPLWWKLHEWLRQRSTLVLQTRASLEALGDDRHVRIIPNPLEPVATSSRPEAKTIVAVGRLVPQKGFDLLLQAFARIADDHPDWSLLIWGDGPERSRLLRERDALGLQDRVELPGVTPQPGSWTKSGSIFVLTSRYEGFPNVLVEAMAAGFPVISFDCPWGPAEIIDNGKDGILVPAEDEESLSRALGDLMDDPAARARLGRAARSSVERFSASRIFRMWEALIEDIVNSASQQKGATLAITANEQLFGAR